MIDGRLGPNFALDSVWVQATEAKLQSKYDRITQELESAKAMMIKDAIRVGHNDLAELLYQAGDLQAAFKLWIRSRDYCTTSKHMSLMSLHTLRVTSEMGSWVHAQNYVSKAEQLVDVTSDPVLLGKVVAVDALALLHSRKYKAAARRFTSISSELGNSFSEVITAQDIATYGTLLALATLDRNEVNAKINQSVSFRQFLDLTPSIREVAKFFYRSVKLTLATP